MNAAKRADGWEAGVKRNTVVLGYWTGAWVATMALAAFGPIYLWDGNRALSLLAILVTLSLGVGLVGGLAYSNLDLANLIAGDAEISNLVILMGLTYAAGIFAGQRKYR